MVGDAVDSDDIMELEKKEQDTDDGITELDGDAVNGSDSAKLEQKE